MTNATIEKITYTEYMRNYMREYRKENGDDLRALVREKYKNDPEYRERIRKRQKAYYQRKKAKTEQEHQEKGMTSM